LCHLPDAFQFAVDLQAWRLECEEKARDAFAKGKRKSASLSPDDFMFENEDGGFLDTDNYRKRVLHKVARKLRLAIPVIMVAIRSEHRGFWGLIEPMASHAIFSNAISY
jgi:hypothetical protein